MKNFNLFRTFLLASFLFTTISNCYSFTIQKNETLNFKVRSKELINTGNIFYSSYFGNEVITDELKKIFQNLSGFKNLNPKGKYVSFSKTAYFVPKAFAQYFAPSQINDKDYIEATVSGVTVLSPKNKNCLRSKKAIPVFADAVVETCSTFYSMNKDSSKAMTISYLVDTDKNTKFMENTYSESYYENVGDLGVIVRTYNIGILDKSKIGFLKRGAIEFANSYSSQAKDNFESETLYMVEQNTNWFSGN